MTDDFDARYRAVVSRDRRFDGRFFTGVTSTGIYCRPICPAKTPAARNVRFFEHAAAAEAAGFRPCRRCHPEVSPDSPAWDVRQDLVGRALRLIADGVVDAEGISGLSSRLAVSERHLHRLFVDEVGAAPLAVARSRRAALARQLLGQTSLSITDVAFAAGFSSIRSFNETMSGIFRATPTQLRNGSRARPGDLVLKLGFRKPFAGNDILAFLSRRIMPGVESIEGRTYRRTVSVDGKLGIVELHVDLESDAVTLRLRAESSRSIATVVQRSRRLLDLDADPAAVSSVLESDSSIAPLVRRTPGIRLPGAYDGFELAVRAILGQQVSVSGAQTLAARLVERAGRALTRPEGALTHTFPSAADLAEADLEGIGLTGSRIRTISVLATSVAGGSVALDGSADPNEIVEELTRIPGIGPWTASYVAMRALRDPDAFPAKDLGIRNALAALGLPVAPREVDQRSERWRPWRGYAAMHLWHSLSNGRGAKS